MSDIDTEVKTEAKTKAKKAKAKPGKLAKKEKKAKAKKGKNHLLGESLVDRATLKFKNEAHKKFCNELFKRRSEKGLSLLAIGQRLEMNPSSYHRIESGKVEPLFTNALHMVKVLDIDVSTLRSMAAAT